MKDLMKRLVLAAFIICCSVTAAQNRQELEEELIKEKVDQFFRALEKQDTVLLKKLWFQEGQVWTIDNTTQARTHSMRFFKEDLKRFDPKIVLQERALSYEIKVHNGMAMAWIPYEFHVNGKFSHCGVDIFSLLKKDQDWKFISASYTVEEKDCK